MLNPSPGQFKIFKAVLFAAAMLPFARLVLFTYTEQLGANPIEFITRNTGDWTLYFLCITLAVTPLRRLTRWNRLIKLRRMMGLFAFFYAALHFTTFLWFDHYQSRGEMAGWQALAAAAPCDLSDRTAWHSALLVDESGQA
jgi:sulfoxide reductase heme-binding subunit YedZ